MENFDRLAFPLHVVSKATELDHIKIEPTDEDTGNRTVIKTIKIKGWEKRLIKKSYNFINKDIKLSLQKLKNPVLLPYLIGGIFYRKGIFICTDLKYKIEEDEKL
jgi:hypothetical protein